MLKTETVASEVGWLSFVIQQWHDDYERFKDSKEARRKFPIDRMPSEIFADHVYVTFMGDFVGSQKLKFWGVRNCMWSCVYPHANMTRPHSRAFPGKQIGDQDIEMQKRLIAEA